MDRKKISYSILKELNDGNKKFSAKDYDIDSDTFGEILDMLMNKGFMSGANIVRAGQGNHVQIIFLDNAQIEFDGIEYLDANSLWAKGYRGLKEIASWIPGIG